MYIKQHFTSVEDPQTNGQTEVVNQVILKGIKKKIEDIRGTWKEHLNFILWVQRTTLQSAMVPVEMEEPTLQTKFLFEGETRSCEPYGGIGFD